MQFLQNMHTLLKTKTNKKTHQKSTQTNSFAHSGQHVLHPLFHHLQTLNKQGGSSCIPTCTGWARTHQMTKCKAACNNEQHESWLHPRKRKSSCWSQGILALAVKQGCGTGTSITSFPLSSPRTTNSPVTAHYLCVANSCFPLSVLLRRAGSFQLQGKSKFLLGCGTMRLLLGATSSPGQPCSRAGRYLLKALPSHVPSFSIGTKQNQRCVNPVWSQYQRSGVVNANAR